MSTPGSPVLNPTSSSLPSAEAMARRRRRRYLADGAARWMVRAGGGGVVIALTLIFVYLFSEVLPMLRGASVEPIESYQVASRFDGEVAGMTLERYDELGMRYSTDGDLSYFSLANGEVLDTI